MLQPEFYEDAKLAKVSRDARLLYPGLWVLSDDVGNVRCDPTFLRSRLFPYDDDVTPPTIAKWLSELAGIGRVQVYEIDGETYAHIVKFSKHQTINRPSKWRNPPPHSRPTHDPVMDEVRSESETEVEVQSEVAADDSNQSPKAPALVDAVVKICSQNEKHTRPSAIKLIDHLLGFVDADTIQRGIARAEIKGETLWPSGVFECVRTVAEKQGIDVPYLILKEAK